MVNTENSHYLFAADQSLDLNFSLYIYIYIELLHLLVF